MNKIDWSQFKYFSKDEFICKCGCGCSNVSLKLLTIIEEARENAGIPFGISSGCRCKKHNTEVGGKENSMHICSVLTECNAVDIYCNTDRKRGIIVRSLFEAGVTHIGINFKENFIHADLDKRIALFPY